MKNINIACTLLGGFLAIMLLQGCSSEPSEAEKAKAQEDFEKQMEEMEKQPGGGAADPEVGQNEDGP